MKVDAKAVIEEANELYERGEYEKTVTTIESAFDAIGGERVIRDGDRAELYAIFAWSKYHLKDFDQARRMSDMSRAMFSVLGTRCRAAIAAYVDNDEVTLRKIVDELPNDLGILNVMVVCARQEGSVFGRDDVIACALGSEGTGKERAHILNNAGRFFLAKSRGDEDLVLALGFFTAAAGLYGSDGNWHHRGGLHYWRSVVLEKLLGKEASVGAATHSLEMWEKAALLDPTNPGFRKNLVNARKRLAELTS